jgi:hypothetical protein
LECGLYVGLILTLLLERLAVGPLDRWTYAPSMPLTELDIGLLPILQWLVLPPLALVLTARQVRGARC